MARSSHSIYKQHVNIDSVLSEVHADELVRKIASRCGAVDENGLWQRPGHGSGRIFEGEGKEVAFSKLEPLPEAADKRQKAIGQLRKLRSAYKSHAIRRLTLF